ncbi:MAG: hypothetical protein KC910_34505, partial [Candidatus Eremiobacteraeota bacterium]|nr:hypothetical protein [Candidatus Eremiobacteraeota bacterium]
NAVFRGRVTGTVIAGVDQSGNLFTVEADNTGIFALQLPTPGTYRLYLIEQFSTAPLVVNGSNLFVVGQPVDFDLGNVTIVNGVAVSSNSILTATGVTDGGTNTAFPAAFINPPTAGLSLDQIFDLGFTALQNGGFVLARGYFKAAAALTNGQTGNDADTANFFYGLTQLAALLDEIQSDGTDNGLNNLGDILDAAGYDPLRRPNITQLMKPIPYAATTPSGESLRQYLAGPARMQFESAIASFEKVSPTFQRTWQVFNPGGLYPGGSVATVESDYGDALAFLSLAKQELAVVLIVSSYDLSGDVGQALNNPGLVTFQAILASNANLLVHVPGANLTPAGQALDSAYDLLGQAITFMQNESDPQTDDFVNLRGLTPMQLQPFLQKLADARQALVNPVALNQPDMSMGTLTLSNYFDADGLNLRQFLPAFTGDQVSGLFGGTPFGDVYNGYGGGTLADPNHDTNMNMVPDILE